MKSIGLCHCCGAPAILSCPLCGKIVCRSCFDAINGVCLDCGTKRQSGFGKRF